MSIVKTNKVWNGMNVVEETDTTLGTIKIYSKGGSSSGNLLASSAADGSWKLNNEPEFRKGFNNAQKTQGKQTLSQAEFEKLFMQFGVPEFNKDRADVLNEPSNYSSNKSYLQFVKSFASSGTPNVINPNAGQQNNSKGKTISSPNQNQNNQTKHSSTPNPNAINIPGYGTGGTQAVLRYPLDRIPDLGYDYVTFSAYEYTAGAFTSRTGANRVGTPMERITFPILPNIEESNGVEWGQDKLNEIQRLAAGVATKAIGADNLGEALTNLVDGTKGAIDELLESNPGMKDAIIAHFAGQAVGANILGRRSGAVLNPNLELLFKGPQLRTFNFSFRLRPRYDKESDMCRDIIRAFKRNMHPQRSTGELFLKTPNIFKINYYFNDGREHPFMNRLKPCALTNFKVNYTPDNNYMTYPDGGMTGYDLNLSFSEIVPVYADQINGEGGMSF